MKILVLNAGSSSLKSHLYDWPAEDQSAVMKVHADWSRGDAVRITLQSAKEGERTSELATLDMRAIIKTLLESLPSPPDIVGHRIVHGGSLFNRPMLLTPEVQGQAMSFSPFAPAHNPIQLDVVNEVEQALGDTVPNYGVFDTAFHATLPPEAYTYAGPGRWVEQGIRRYGFHGISHQYVSFKAARILEREATGLKLITAHLGNGCSMTAVDGGISVATTMGFTTLDGLVMGTRSGAVDPAILIHLVRARGYSAPMLEAELSRESGLKGLSGISGDVRDVQAAVEQGNEQARLAMEIYTTSAARHAAGLMTTLGRLDALVFTGGVGENSAEVRAAIGTKLRFMGIDINFRVNESKPMNQVISTINRKPAVLVVRSEEDWEIARQCFEEASSQGHN